MATQLTHRIDSMEYVRDFMAQRGVHPGADGRYDEPAILDGIRARGWEPRVDGGPGAWTVDLLDWRTPTHGWFTVAEEPDRDQALLSGLWEAIRWMTETEADEVFDRPARRKFGVGGEDFLRRWRDGKLDADEPSVVYVMPLRSCGR